jgi:hypothetical protein
MGCRRGKRAESPNRRKIGNMIRTKLPARRIPGFMARLIVGLATTLLLWNGAAVVVGAGAAEAPRIPAPQSWPGCPPDHPEGPCHWCPGDPPVQTGNLRVNPVIWDTNVCHTYWYVWHGQGNVAQNIFEGDGPPPPPPGLNFCPIPPWCP